MAQIEILAFSCFWGTEVPAHAHSFRRSDLSLDHPERQKWTKNSCSARSSETAACHLLLLARQVRVRFRIDYTALSFDADILLLAIVKDVLSIRLATVSFAFSFRPSTVALKDFVFLILFTQAIFDVVTPWWRHRIWTSFSERRSRELAGQRLRSRGYPNIHLYCLNNIEW